MTAPATLSPSPSSAPRAAVRPSGFGDAVAAEWIKFRTLRSTQLSVLLAVVGVLVIGAIGCGVQAHHLNGLPPGVTRDIDPVLQSMNGWYLAQLILGTLGVLAITNEYGNAMITTTFMAIPRRRMVLASKVTVTGAAVLAVATVTSLVAFWVGQAFLASARAGVSIGDPGVARAVLGAALYVTLIAFLGLAFGAIARHTAGGITALFGLLFLPPVISEAFPTSWQAQIQKYSPMNAGSQIVRLHAGGHNGLSPWTGLGVLCLYVVAALVAAFWLIQRRDA